VSVKPVIYGSIAARVARIPAIVNAMAGLGFLFSSEKFLARVLRPTIKFSFRLLLNNQRTTVILQNPDDLEVLCGGGTVDRNRVRLIRGSGVDTAIYEQRPETDEVPIVLLASRLLWDKGIGEFVEAARRIRREGIQARFVIAGEGDDENPASISSNQLQEWSEEGDVEIWGRRTDMPAVFAGVHIVCLPTYYGEGVPKVLIEAASCGRPIVATDAPGCREIVIDGRNGILIPINDTEALASAIRKLLLSLERVNRETLAIYGSVG
jgi:glycosyltransferase involved in cell wall biosynthesis